MSKQEKLYKQQRFQDGDWSDVKAKDASGKSVLRVAKVTPEQVKMMNQDVKRSGLKWVACSPDEIKSAAASAKAAKEALANRSVSEEESEVKEFNPSKAKVAELDEYIADNEIKVEDGAKTDAKRAAIKEFIESKSVQETE